MLAVKSHLTCLSRRDPEREVEMLACVIYTSLSPLFVFCYRCFIVLLSLMSFLSRSSNSYKDIHPQNCLMSFSWAILIFTNQAYKYIYLYFYLYLYNINIRKSDDWNLHRPSKRYRIVLNRPCFHGKDGKPMFNLMYVNHSYV